MHYQKNKKNLTSYLVENKEIAITFCIIVFCLLLSFFFPINNSAQLLTRNIFFLVLFPILYYKIILKKNLSDFGLNLDNKKNGIFWGATMSLVNLVIFYLLYTYTAFGKNYLLPNYIVHNFWPFFFYELILVNIFVFIQEFFYRGFVLLYFSKKIGCLAIFLQLIIFVLFLLPTGNSFWQMTPTLVISLTSGIIVYRSKSFLYSWASALLSLIILDSFIIYHLR
jgi:membrane protease YdiL (CAAX protease family)